MKPAVALVFAILSLALPSAAMAGTAQLDLDPAPGGGQVENLVYRAAPGEQNRLTVRFNDGNDTFTLHDTAGITAGSQCSRPAPSDTTRVTCVRSSGGIGSMFVRLGDRDDRANVAGLRARVRGDSGSDRLTGGSERDVLIAGTSLSRTSTATTRDRLSGGGGPDRLLGSSGANRMSGGNGSDVVLAGRAGDRINDRDGEVDQVNCGGGRDVARLDTFDFLADRCRTVRRPGIPAATPIELFTAGTSAFVVVGCPRDARTDRCRGSVKLTRGSRSFGTKRFNIARGRERTTSGFRLPASLRNQIGPTGGPDVRVTVRSRSSARTVSTFFVRIPLPPPGD